MKSLLQEGSSVVRTVEAAWNKAGKPVEFSIKILKNEEQRFLGIPWKNSVVVSITYDYAHHERRQAPHRNNKNEKGNKKINQTEILEKVMRDTERLHSETNCFADSYPVKKEKSRPEKQVKREPKEAQPTENRRKEKKGAQVPPVKETQTAPEKRPEQHNLPKATAQNPTIPEVTEEVVKKERWTEEMIQAVVSFLQEIFSIMEITVPFTHHIDGLQCKITFERPLCNNSDQEYKMYTSLAFIMLQMIKQEFKKKYKGYRVIFSVKDSPKEVTTE